MRKTLKGLCILKVKLEDCTITTYQAGKETTGMQIMHRPTHAVYRIGSEKFPMSPFQAREMLLEGIENELRSRTQKGYRTGNRQEA